jgi:hypothetical protein
MHPQAGSPTARSRQAVLGSAAVRSYQLSQRYDRRRARRPFHKMCYPILE